MLPAFSKAPPTFSENWYFEVEPGFLTSPVPRPICSLGVAATGRLSWSIPELICSITCFKFCIVCVFLLVSFVCSFVALAKYSSDDNSSMSATAPTPLPTNLAPLETRGLPPLIMLPAFSKAPPTFSELI